MTAQEAIEYIENYTWSSTRLGLDRTRELLRRMGDPQKKLRFIHVAGSNGKGSTCAMLASIMQASGYRTGLYTSPYIQEFCERMQINGENIPGSELARITEWVMAIADGMDDHPSQFELVTAIAMQYFADAECDIVVLEVGMGGALDATNVIDALECAVITNIGLEHTEYLGDTLTKIAVHKGGIIKPGCDMVCYDSEAEVMSALRGICAEKNVPFRVSGESDSIQLYHDLFGQRFSWKGEEYFIPLLGHHQMRNAGVVLETVDVLRGRGWNVSETAVRAGLKNTHWPARFEILNRDPLFILDGGHNPQCAEALAANLAEYLPGAKITFLMGVLRDKDFGEMLDLISPYADSFVCVTPDSPRAMSGEELTEIICARGLNAEYGGSIEKGIVTALSKGNTVVAFGSLYMAGHVRSEFTRSCKKWQRKTVLARRDKIDPAQREEKSAQICENICSSELYKKAKTIMLFKSFRSEASLTVFEAQAEKDGKTLLYPYCIENFEMLALKPGGEWVKDKYGISVPNREKSESISPEDIDLVICPCSAFDGEGGRLGMGAGYYDRFLPRCVNARFMLAAFEAQRVEKVFADEHDMRMDAVVTEQCCEMIIK